MGASQQETQMRLGGYLEEMYGIDLDLKDDSGDGYEPLSFFESADNDDYFAMRTLEDYQDVQLFIEVSIGSQHQPMRLIVDSGSTWFWVQTVDC